MKPSILMQFTKNDQSDYKISPLKIDTAIRKNIIVDNFGHFPFGRDKKYWFVYGQEGYPDHTKPSMWINHRFPKGYGIGSFSSGMTKERMFYGFPPDPAGFNPYGDAPNAWKPTPK